MQNKMKKDQVLLRLIYGLVVGVVFVLIARIALLVLGEFWGIIAVAVIVSVFIAYLVGELSLFYTAQKK